MHPKNPRAYCEPDPEAVDPVDHEVGDRITVFCLTCESGERGEVESTSDGVCWRCGSCGGAQDISVVA